MTEFKGLLASSSKAINENAGFLTPQNKNIVSRKALFTDKPKMALGDLKKNSFNVTTPMKNGTNEKQQAPKLSTPKLKPTVTFHEIPNSTPKPERNVIDYSLDELDVRCQKMNLEESQFDLIFMIGPTIAPPSPEPQPLSPHDYKFEVPYPDFEFDSIGDFERTTPDDEYELPALNLSF